MNEKYIDYKVEFDDEIIEVKEISFLYAAISACQIRRKKKKHIIFSVITDTSNNMVLTSHGLGLFVNQH